MKEYKTSEAQRRASKKWDQENRRHKMIRGYRANGINYIKNYATLEDLEEFLIIVNEKMKELKNTQ